MTSGAPSLPRPLHFGPRIVVGGDTPVPDAHAVAATCASSSFVPPLNFSKIAATKKPPRRRVSFRATTQVRRFAQSDRTKSPKGKKLKPAAPKTARLSGSRGGRGRKNPFCGAATHRPSILSRRTPAARTTSAAVVSQQTRESLSKVHVNDTLEFPSNWSSKSVELAAANHPRRFIAWASRSPIDGTGHLTSFVYNNRVLKVGTLKHFDGSTAFVGPARHLGTVKSLRPVTLQDCCCELVVRNPGLRNNICFGLATASKKADSPENAAVYCFDDSSLKVKSKEVSESKPAPRNCHLLRRGERVRVSLLSRQGFQDQFGQQALAFINKSASSSDTRWVVFSLNGKLFEACEDPSEGAVLYAVVKLAHGAEVKLLAPSNAKALVQASIAIQRFDTAMMGQLRHMHAAHRGHVQRCRLEAYTKYKLILEGSLLRLGGDKSMRHAQSAVRQMTRAMIADRGLRKRLVSLGSFIFSCPVVTREVRKHVFLRRYEFAYTKFAAPKKKPGSAKTKAQERVDASLLGNQVVQRRIEWRVSNLSGRPLRLSFELGELKDYALNGPSEQHFDVAAYECDSRLACIWPLSGRNKSSVEPASSSSIGDSFANQPWSVRVEDIMSHAERQHSIHASGAVAKAAAALAQQALNTWTQFCDAHGLQATCTSHAQLRKMGSKATPKPQLAFVDTSFPPMAASLTGKATASPPNFAANAWPPAAPAFWGPSLESFAGIADTFVCWRRASSVLPFADTRIFGGAWRGKPDAGFQSLNIDPLDIHPSALANSNLASALSAIAEHPQLVINLFVRQSGNESSLDGILQWPGLTRPPSHTENGDFHLYHVNTCANGVWSKVAVDDFIPCWGLSGPAFTSSNSQLWVVLVEKALAKAHGGYHALKSIDSVAVALRELTGGNVQTYKLRQDAIRQQHETGVLGQLLAQLTGGGQVVVASDAEGVASSVLQVNTSRKNHKRFWVKLRCVSGVPAHKNGVLLEAPRDAVPQSATSSVEINDGTFWVSGDNFLKHFDRMTVCFVKSLTAHPSREWGFNSQFAYKLTPTEPLCANIWACDVVGDYELSLTIHQETLARRFDVGVMLLRLEGQEGQSNKDRVKLVGYSSLSGSVCANFTTRVEQGSYLVVPYSAGCQMRLIHQRKQTLQPHQRTPSSFPFSLRVHASALRRGSSVRVRAAAGSLGDYASFGRGLILRSGGYVLPGSPPGLVTYLHRNGAVATVAAEVLAQSAHPWRVGVSFARDQRGNKGDQTQEKGQLNLFSHRGQLSTKDVLGRGKSLVVLHNVTRLRKEEAMAFRVVRTFQEMNDDDNQHA